MVEMLEARNAIMNATSSSLILFDEIGRGTSTYDGMALAQAIMEYIHEEIGAKTLFSTHYHELTVLSQSLAKLENIHVSAIEQNGHLVFLHKIKDGAADKSYGIHVAKLAELPESLIERASEILERLENEGEPRRKEAAAPAARPVQAEAEDPAEAAAQLSFFSEPDVRVQKPSNKEKKIIEELKAAEVLEMTPLDAINLLYKLQKKLKS